MAFEKGNTLAAKRRQFEATVWRALAGEDFAKLRRIVDNMLDQAIAGKRWAVEMVRDTLDGKPAQQIIATDNEGRGLTVVLASLTASLEHSVQSGSEPLPALPLQTTSVPEEAPPIPGEWH